MGRKYDDDDQRKGSSRGTGRFPSDQGTETNVIGACISEGIWWEIVSNMAGSFGAPSLFFDSDMASVAEAMTAIVERGSKISTVSLSAALDDMLGEDHFNGGSNAYIVTLMSNSSISRPSDLESAVSRLIEMRTKRNQLEEIERVRLDAYDPKINSFDISDRLRSISAQAVTAASFHTAAEVLDGIESVEHAKWCSPTGISKMDKALGGGFEPGRLNVIAARPKVGKTSFILNCALSAFIEQEYTVLFCSLEMDDTELMTRMISALSLVDAHKVGKILNKDDMTVKDLAPDERREFQAAYQDIRDSKLQLMFVRDIKDGVNDIVNNIMSLRSRLGEDEKIVVFVDYLQLLLRDSFNGRAQMDEITRNLKLAALSNGVAIVAPSQINRSGADGGMPGPHQMKESGGIEQDADTVTILHRPALDDPEADPNIMEFWVALNRNGPNVRFSAAWIPETYTIEDLDEDDLVATTVEYAGARA